jgi:caffeoyl-CoA O-methyltransferase
MPDPASDKLSSNPLWHDRADQQLSDYCDSVTSNEPPVCRRIRERAKQHPRGHWTTGPHVATLLKLLVSMSGARRVLEFGTFFGYSAAYMASAHPEVQVTTIEFNADNAREARALLANSRVESRINIVQTDAGTWLKAHPREEFDLVFFDATRRFLMEIYEPLLLAVRPGGILVMDNSLANGGAMAPSNPREIATAEFNARLKQEPGFVTTLLPIRDGVLISRRTPGTTLRPRA